MSLPDSQRTDFVTDIIQNTLRQNLSFHRRDPWANPAICAAFEFAQETDCLAVFDGIWNQVEVRGEFKCRGTEIPPEISVPAALRAGN